MLERTPFSDTDQTSGPQLRQTLDQIDNIVLDRLRHGHFRFTISTGVGKTTRRDPVI